MSTEKLGYQTPSGTSTWRIATAWVVRLVAAAPVGIGAAVCVATWRSPGRHLIFGTRWLMVMMHSEYGWLRLDEYILWNGRQHLPGWYVPWGMVLVLASVPAAVLVFRSRRTRN